MFIYYPPYKIKNPIMAVIWHITPYIYFRKNESPRNYYNCSLQTRSLGSWISAYLGLFVLGFFIGTPNCMCACVEN